YSHRDRSFACRLVKDLQVRGISVWWDDHELKVGDSIIDRVSKGIRESDYLVTVLSPDSVTSRWAQEELRQASSLRVESGGTVGVLAMMYRDCVVPHFLTGILYADFRDPAEYDHALARLIDAIGEAHNRAVVSNEQFLTSLRLSDFYQGQILDALTFLR